MGCVKIDHFIGRKPNSGEICNLSMDMAHIAGSKASLKGRNGTNPEVAYFVNYLTKSLDSSALHIYFCFWKIRVEFQVFVKNAEF